MEQLNTPVAQYSVSYSIDGGKEWIAGPAECAQSPCRIKDLPAGTNALVRVNAWGQAGEGEPSELVTAPTGGAAPRVGCTYPEAANFDSTARNDDGSCVAGNGRRLFSGSKETVVLTLTASGSVSDYTDSVKSSLQQKIADLAGVHKSLVTIRVTAASVIITATIAVPAATTADQVQTSLSSSLGTAADASTALDITVEEAPTITSSQSSSTDSTNVAAIVGGVLGGLAAGCILTILVVVIRMRASKSTQAKKDVVHVTVSDPAEGTAPESLAALLAACGLEHHASAFEAEAYTLETLLGAMKQGGEAAMRDLRELKLNLGDCRKIVNQLKTK